MKDQDYLYIGLGIAAIFLAKSIADKGIIPSLVGNQSTVKNDNFNTNTGSGSFTWNLGDAFTQPFPIIRDIFNKIGGWM